VQEGGRGRRGEAESVIDVRVWLAERSGEEWRIGVEWRGEREGMLYVFFSLLGRCQCCR
jgi:hypothetical protein